MSYIDLIATKTDAARSRNDGSIMRCLHRQVFPVERLDNFGGQNTLELFRVSVLVPEVAEHVAAGNPMSADTSQLLPPGNRKVEVLV